MFPGNNLIDDHFRLIPALLEPQEAVYRLRQLRRQAIQVYRLDHEAVYSDPRRALPGLRIRKRGEHHHTDNKHRQESSGLCPLLTFFVHSDLGNAPLRFFPCE